LDFMPNYQPVRVMDQIEKSDDGIVQINVAPTARRQGAGRGRWTGFPLVVS